VLHHTQQQPLTQAAADLHTHKQADKKTTRQSGSTFTQSCNASAARHLNIQNDEWLERGIRYVMAPVMLYSNTNNATEQVRC
jgi:hypothetical protein